MSPKPKKPDAQAMIMGLLSTKSCMKQDVFQNTITFFDLLKEVLAGIAEELGQQAKGCDERLVVAFTDKGAYACELRVAGDVLIFHMHTNVFKLDQSHSLWKSSYLEEDELRGYFGVVNIYNFLSDSFKYNRERDLGYLVARLFLNRDNKFFLQGKRQLGFLYDDLVSNDLDRERIRQLILSVVLYVLEFDLLARPAP